MNIGDLVTQASAPLGAPTWAGRVGTVMPTSIPECSGLPSSKVGGRVSRLGGGAWAMIDFEVRPLTDDEALAVAAWLVTGDPGAEWEREDDAACLSGNGYTLWSVDDGEWSVFEERDVNDCHIARGRVPTAHAGRVAAARTLLGHLCICADEEERG